MISHTLYTMLYITAGPRDMVSWAAVLSHTLCTRLDIAGGKTKETHIEVYPTHELILRSLSDLAQLVVCVCARLWCACVCVLLQGFFCIWACRSLQC